jgi:hypothetical protein
MCVRRLRGYPRCSRRYRSRCPVLGIPLDRSPRDNTPSLDRIIPARGYVPSNVIVVSLRANQIKGDATVRELLAIARFYERYKRRT